MRLRSLLVAACVVAIPVASPAQDNGAKDGGAQDGGTKDSGAKASGAKAGGTLGRSAAITLAVPQTYDLRQAAPASPGAASAQRLRDAPLPDPSTVPKPDNSLHDSNTGADTTAFGTAYSYANPLYGTQSGSGIAGAVSKSAGLPQMGGGLVLFEWGYPPPPMPKVAGEDLTQAPPPVSRINFAVQADDQPVLDGRARWIIARAVQAYGRAGLTEITIERPAHAPGCCARYPDLVRAELVRSGLGPDLHHLLPGHRIRLVLASLPASR